MVSGVVVSLLFLQFSCAGMQERAAEETPVAGESVVEEAPAAVETVAEEADLLADTHKSAGVSCTDCHLELPPAGGIPGETCLGCHEDYEDLTAGMYLDPHNAHVSYPDCGSCHHIHQPSENQCLKCHAF